MNIRNPPKGIDILTDFYTNWSLNVDDYLAYDKKNYATEDNYDQIICRSARRLGFDTIVLALMTGKNRFVSEILDVRDREVSLNSWYSLK